MILTTGRCSHYQMFQSSLGGVVITTGAMNSNYLSNSVDVLTTRDSILISRRRSLYQSKKLSLSLHEGSQVREGAVVCRAAVGDMRWARGWALGRVS